MKKTLKMFWISFTLSSFAIWVANELFFSVYLPRPSNIDLPPKNIALFFQKTDNIPQSLKVKEIAAVNLPTLQHEKVEEYDINVFDDTTFEAKAIAISSIEDVADIPLEYAPQEKEISSNRDKQAEASIVPDGVVADAKEVIPSTFETAAVVAAPKEGSDVESSNKSAGAAQADTIELAFAQETAETLNETDFIPLENSNKRPERKAIEIVDKAPQNQVAMVDTHISIDTSAVETNDIAETPKIREWHAMSEISDSPWVVAKANKFAKNSKAVEDFAAEGKEAEIENLLYPEKAESTEKTVQTAEMVKNILIPIPEDILNDKNLTPQLVSPKKALFDDEDESYEEEDVDSKADDKKKKGFLKSITSLFGASDDEEGGGGVEDNDESESDDGTGKKGGLSAFKKNKTPTKILPAEMKLSFQPGRAEISGQTLRWIQAFANKAAEDPDTILEIRIDKNSSYALQQRRLELLHTVLDGRGISDDKLNTVFTSREPNSFIIRTLRISDNSSGQQIKNRQRKNTSYQTW